MVLTVQFPVLPHVLKYLQQKHGNELKLSRRHNEGKMLYHMLRNQQHNKKFDVALERYSGMLPLHISLDNFKERKCNNITNRTIYDFNDFIDSQIKEEFLHYVNTLMGVDIKFTMDQMIDGFMGKYFFDDSDLNPLTLKQHYYRTEREKHGNKWFKKKKTSSKPAFSAVVVTSANAA